MNIKKIAAYLEEKRGRLVDIKHLISKLNDKYSDYNNFDISLYNGICEISFKSILSTQGIKITNKLLNRPDYSLMIYIDLEEEYEDSKMSYSIAFGDKIFPENYFPACDRNIPINFKTNEKPENLINAIDYFIDEMKNHISNINISKEKYIEIFNTISDSRYAYAKSTIKKYKQEFKKNVANNFDIITIDNLKDFVDYITNIKVNRGNKNNIIRLLKVILFNNLHIKIEKKFNLKG